jgi:DNA-directed RNA polymerase subunit RPC12/RpoP
VRKKEYDRENTHLSQAERDEPFGDPPIMFNYRCSDCNYSSEMNEAHIDVAYGWTKKRTISSYGKVPVLECPNCEKEAFICVD